MKIDIESVFIRLRTWHMLIGVLLFFLILGTFKIIPLRPQSIHQWAQCDRASVAWNYYTTDTDFFHPRVNNTDNGSGITGMEFPIVQYVVSLLYRFFGFHEWLYRLTTLTIFTIGAFSVYRIARYFIQDKMYALLTMGWYICSPLLAFYSSSFLPDIYSLSFAMISWAALLKLKDRYTGITMMGWILPLLLSCLIKPNSLIHLPVMLFFLYREGVWSKKTRIQLSGCFLIVVAATFSWYYYASWLSKSVQSEVFLLHVRPPNSWQEVKDVWERVRLDWLERIYHPWILILILVSGVVLLVVERPFRNKLATYTLIMLFSCSAFLYVMFLQLSYHDYYFITMFPSLVFLLIFIFSSINTRVNTRGKYVFAIIVLGLLAIQFYFAKAHVRFAYQKGTWMYGSLHNDMYFEPDYFLKAAGVKAEDQIICIFDHSPNISLYLMGQKGVTIPCRNVPETLMGYLHTGRFKYLIFNEFSSADNVTFNYRDYPLEEVFELNGIHVFTLSSSFHPSGKPAKLSPWN